MELSFIKMPNLPEYSVLSLLIGDKYAKFLGQILQEHGISVIEVPQNLDIAPPLSSHADMSVCHIGGNNLVAVESVYYGLKSQLPCSAKLLKVENYQKAEYPDDICINACIIGDKLLHNLKYTDPVLSNEANILGLKTINVKQGYTKCSVCVLSADRIITSDTGIHETAINCGITSLLIQSGFIKLDGYDTGFIGGACGKISSEKIAFTGRLSVHPDESKILNFVEESGLEAVFLTDDDIFDIGSMLPLLERTI